jgi:phage terminase large subunit
MRDYINLDTKTATDNTPHDILIPSEYARLFDTDWREAAIHGGRGSLKSHTVARILLIRAMQKRGRCGCFREYQNSIADSSHALLKSLIEEYNLPYFKVTNDSILNTKTGYDFIFKGLRNNIQSVKSIEGMTEAWVEEAQTISEISLDVLTPTVRLPGSQIFYTYNRLKDKDPIHNRLVIEGRPNTIVINVNYDTAIKYGWLSDVLTAEMESDRDNRPEIYKHKWLGMPSNLKGQIYKNFKQVESIPKDAKYLGDGLDWGYTNDPTALIEVWKWNNAYILHEALYEKGMKNKEIASQILGRSHYSNHVVVGDSSEPKSIDDLIDEGVTIIGATKGKDSVNNGIQLLQGLEIYYTAQSHNIEEEVLNYQWKIDKEDKSLNVPIDAYNHAMDAARYKIMDIENFRPIVFAASR